MTTKTVLPTYSQILKTIGVPGIVPGIKEKLNPELMSIAEKNKISLLFSDAADIEQQERHLKMRHERMMETLKEVALAFNEAGIRYSVFKTIKPFPTTPSDVDVLLSNQDFGKAQDLLISRGYYRTTSDAYSSTMEKDKMIVDLQLQPSVSNLPYLPKALLMQNTMMKKMGDVDVCTLTPEAEIIVIASHSFFKEQMFTLNDYYSIIMFAEHIEPDKLIEMASRANVLEVLKIIVGLCSHITESMFAERLKIAEMGRLLQVASHRQIVAMPLKFPFSLIIKHLIGRARKDDDMRRKVVPAVIRIASPSQLAKLFSHITRKTY